MNESTVKYLAGLIDADGSLSFGFKRDQNRPHLFFLSMKLNLTASDNVDRHGYVEHLPDLTDMGCTSRYGKQKQFVVWSVSRRNQLEMILPRLIKHMVIKGKHFQWMLDFWRENRGQKTFGYDERIAITQASKESRKNNVGPLKPKNHATWAWVAGYLDGDGCYSYRSNRANTGYDQWTINVSAVAHVTDIVGLEFLLKCFGGRIEPQGQSPNVKIWKRSLGYQNRSFALKFLPKVARHSKLKREKIDAMIHHHQQRLSVPGTNKTFCTIDGCDSQTWGHGLCSKHYQRDRRKKV